MASIEPKELVDLGFYKSEPDVIEDGIRHLLRSHPEFRMRIAVEKYKREEISIGKAAELSGVSLEEMMDILREQGILLKGSENAEEIQEDAQRAKKVRW